MSSNRRITRSSAAAAAIANSFSGRRVTRSMAAAIPNNGRRRSEDVMDDVVRPLPPHRRLSAREDASSARDHTREESGTVEGSGGGERKVDSRHRWIRCHFFDTFLKPELFEAHRSFPGAPPRERRNPYDMPFAELGREEKAAAATLGWKDEQSWELSMPRKTKIVIAAVQRVLQYDDPTRAEDLDLVSTLETVGVCQEVTWGGLSHEKRDAALLLGLSQRVWDDQLTTFHDLKQRVWDDQLATFHDDLWWVDGICMEASEFQAFLDRLGRMSEAPLKPRDLAQFLLDLGRVFTPSQAKKMYWVLVSSVAGETLKGAYGRPILHLLVASFLSDPRRFVDLPWFKREMYWRDSQLPWFHSESLRLDKLCASTPDDYATALKGRHYGRLAKLSARPILVGAISPHKYTGGSTPLPGLPDDIAREILDEWLEDEPLELSSIARLTHNGDCESDEWRLVNMEREVSQNM